MGHPAIRPLLVVSLLAWPFLAQAATRVGSAAAVRNSVQGTVAGPMHTGSPVHQSETVSSGTDSSAQLLFRDKTSLTLGPNSQVTIDKFVYDPAPGTGQVTVKLVKGALRFVAGTPKTAGKVFTIRGRILTGLAPPSGTPPAGPPPPPGQGSPPPPPGQGSPSPPSRQGTVAEVYVSDLGREFVLLIAGGLSVCSTRGCASLTTPGQYITLSPDGSLSPPAAWTGPMLNLTASADFLQAYLAQRLERGNDILPRYRDITDALRTRDFTPPEDFFP